MRRKSNVVCRWLLLFFFSRAVVVDLTTDRLGSWINTVAADFCCRVSLIRCAGFCFVSGGCTGRSDGAGPGGGLADGDGGDAGGRD